MNWNEHFTYDPTIPEGIRWARFASNNRIKPGTPAGKYLYKSKLKPERRGYYRTYVLTRSYANHRIIWEMFNSPLVEGEQVDHLDGNTDNNCIENLRVVNNQTNTYNQKKRNTNKSGVTGIHITDNGNGKFYWTASWMDRGKRCGTMYSIDKYGYDTAREMALKDRLNAEEMLKEQDINITERHGK